MNIGTSIRRLANLFIILFMALSAGLVYWQVVVAKQVEANTHNSRRCLLENSPLRGTIYDRNGQWLAKSVPDNNPNACGYRREYADPSLANLIGYYAGPNYPATGIEKQFDDVLTGRTGMTTLNNTVNQLLHRAPVGNDIYLTVDDRIQKIVDRRFSDPYYNGSTGASFAYPSNAGAVIVSNPHTGEILAMLSRPGYDPNKLVQTLQNSDLSYYNQLVQDPEQPLLERPLQGNFIPGSTFKTVTLMAALDAGKTTLSQQWQERQARGPVFFDGHPIGPEGNNIDGYTFRFPVTTEYGFAHSDNVIFAQLGVNTGFDTWMNYVKSFYVGQQIPFDLPVSVSTVLPSGRQEMSKLELAANSFGQGTDFVTPLQMSVIDNIVASNGRLVQPKVIYKITEHKTIDNEDAPTIQTFSPQVLGTPIKPDTAVAVRQGMYGVIQCGPGPLEHVRMNTSPWSIIGKTGTAQLSGKNDTGQLPIPDRAHGWLITQAPYSVQKPDQLPALTVIALREHGGDGATSVGPMIANIYDDVFSNGYVKADKLPIPGLSYCYRTGLLQTK